MCSILLHSKECYKLLIENKFRLKLEILFVKLCAPKKMFVHKFKVVLFFKTRAIPHVKFFIIPSKVNLLTQSSFSISLPRFKAAALIVYEISY